MRVVQNPPAPDLTFLDVDMPDMYGITFAEQAKGYSNIIFITSMPDYPKSRFPDEPFEYLPKPISYRNFLQCIERIRQK